MRDQLLDAAARMLELEGASVTTRRIAEEAGCAEGSIYNHFATKEELLVCAVAERLAAFPALVLELGPVASATEVRRRLDELATEALDFFSRLAPVLGGTLGGRGQLHARARLAHEAGHGPWRTVERIAAWLDDERARGNVSAHADATAAATALLGACLFQATIAHSWGPRLAPDPATAADRAVAAIWSGLAPPVASSPGEEPR